MVGTTNDILPHVSSPLSNSPQNDDLITDYDVTDDDPDDGMHKQRSETKSSMPFSSAGRTRGALHGEKLGEDERREEERGGGANQANQGGETRPPLEGKPCYQLCRKVELSCPFLNPSTASGGRPVFACPSLIGE